MHAKNDPNPTLVMLVGGSGNAGVERAIRQARQAAACDLLETLWHTGRIARAIVATDDPEWTCALPHAPVEVIPDPPDRPFHFGQRLAELIETHNADTLLYAGGGAAPLMSAQDWSAVLAELEACPRCAITNNLHSSDWAAFRPAKAVLPLVAAQTRDNGLAWTLANDAGLPTHALPASAASRFDLDTPADLLIARAHPRLGRHLRAALDALDWPTAPLEGVMRVMAKEGGHLTVVGRSSSTAWAALEQQTRCFVRLFVEERGMIATGRLAQGEVRSLLADYLTLVGAPAFFERLASMAEAILLDSRVVMGALGLWPPATDRFNADLLRWREVEDPFLRAFSRAASEIDVPMLMGGQSVVAGGLMALLEALAPKGHTDDA
ncbi:MAG: hypothetical protein JXD18_03685 [Anaerolineae bacterium]|nr:hypothetical protein [Anaerolineae bacterium]